MSHPQVSALSLTNKKCNIWILLPVMIEMFDPPVSYDLDPPVSSDLDSPPSYD